jgi:Flp pilus assembly pilin Flp
VGQSTKACLVSFARAIDGAAAVEFGLVSVTFITLLIAIMDFGLAFWQWNSATKALQLGARLSATSDPVSSDIKDYAVEPGLPIPSFERVCAGGACSNGGSFDLGALQILVYGARGLTACPNPPQGRPAMCHLFPQIRPENLRIVYSRSGTVASGAQGSAAPTISLSLTGLTYDLVALDRLIGLGPIPMTGLSVTATAEDLSGS